MPTVLKSAAIVIGAYLGSVALHFVWLLIGALVAGKSLGPLAGYCMLAVVAASALTLLASTLAVFFGLRWAGATGGWRIGVVVGYLLLAVATWLVLALTTAVAFNR